MGSLDEAAEIVGKGEDPIIAAVERLVKNAYRSGRRDVLAEVEALVEKTQRAWQRAWPRTPIAERAVGYILDEIEALRDRFGITNVEFSDLTAMLTKEWILELCTAVRRRRLGVTLQLPTGTRSEAIDRAAAEALLAAGVRNFTLAPDAGPARVPRAGTTRGTTRPLVRSGRPIGADIPVVTTSPPQLRACTVTSPEPAPTSSMRRRCPIRSRHDASPNSAIGCVPSQPSASKSLTTRRSTR